MPFFDQLSDVFDPGCLFFVLDWQFLTLFLHFLLIGIFCLLLLFAGEFVHLRFESQIFLLEMGVAGFVLPKGFIDLVIGGVECEFLLWNNHSLEINNESKLSNSGKWRELKGQLLTFYNNFRMSQALKKKKETKMTKQTQEELPISYTSLTQLAGDWGKVCPPADYPHGHSAQLRLLWDGTQSPEGQQPSRK